MKYLKFLLLLIIISSGFSTVQAQYLGTLSSFALVPSSDKITVAPNTTTTTVKFEVVCFRQTASGSTNWAPFKMNFKLGTDRAGSKELLPTVYTMTSTDFNPGVGGGSKQFTATISNSKLYNGAYLILASNIPNTNNGGVLDTNYTAYTGSRYFINVTPPAVDPNIAKIQAMGFNTSGLKTYTTYYVAENDIRISKSALALNNTNYSVNNTYDQNINMLLDSQLVDKWYSKVLAAVKVWNSNPNSNIKVNLLTNNAKYAVPPRIDVSIIRNGGLPSSATEAQFPDGNGTPGTLIAVNQTSPGNLVHAIGHILGLKHTPANAPDYQNSVMKLESTVELLSVYDIDKIATIYPVNNNSIVKPYIVGRETLSSYFEQNSWFLSYLSNEPGINYHWKVIAPNGTVYYDSPSNESSLSELGGMPKGTYQLQCTISGGKYSTPVTVTKDIIEL